MRKLLTRIIAVLALLLVAEELTPTIGSKVWPIEQSDIRKFIDNLKKPYIPDAQTKIFESCVYVPAFLFYQYELCVETRLRDDPTCGVAVNAVMVRNPSGLLGYWRNSSPDRMMLRTSYTAAYFNENGKICPALGVF